MSRLLGFPLGKLPLSLLLLIEEELHNGLLAEKVALSGDDGVFCGLKGERAVIEVALGVLHAGERVTGAAAACRLVLEVERDRC